MGTVSPKQRARSEWRRRKARRELRVKLNLSLPIRRMMARKLHWIFEEEIDSKVECAKGIVEALKELWDNHYRKKM